MTARSPVRLCLRSRRRPACPVSAGYLGLLRAGRDGDRGCCTLRGTGEGNLRFEPGTHPFGGRALVGVFREAGQDQGLQVLAHVSATFAGDRVWETCWLAISSGVLPEKGGTPVAAW